LPCRRPAARVRPGRPPVIPAFAAFVLADPYVAPFLEEVNRERDELGDGAARDEIEEFFFAAPGPLLEVERRAWVAVLRYGAHEYEARHAQKQA
jgi:hypothetical protein